MKPIIGVLKGQTTSTIPVWLMRQAGRHLPEYRKLRKKTGNFLSFCYSPELASEATLQPIKRYGFDAAILFSDILVVPDALGQKVEFKEGIGPILTPIKTKKDIENLSIKNLHSHLLPVYKTIEKTLPLLPKETALFSFSGGPWTLAAYMVEGKTSREFTEARLWATKSPGEFQALIDILIDSISEYLLYQIKYGSEAIQIFETWAGVLSQKEFDRWVIKPTRKIIENVKKKHPNFPIIGFPKGAGIKYLDFVCETGVDAVSIDSTIPLLWAKENLQRRCPIQGNLDNVALLGGGREMLEDVKNIIKTFRDRPFIFNLGHGVLPQTPVTHVEKLLNIIRTDQFVS